MESPQAKFEGWAVIELFGHQREAGYVTTEYFGSGALFRVEVPALPEREIITDRPQWLNDELVPTNSRVAREAVAGRTRFLGPGSIYALNPCSEEACRKALDAMSPRTVKVIELAQERQLVGVTEESEDYEYDDSNDDEKE